MESKRVEILAIDDNPDNLISIKALINEAFPEYLIHTALSGDQGLEIANRVDLDVILLDIIMPEMDGFEVCRKLKSDPKLSDIPVVFVTAIKGDKDARIAALECGAEAFLAKPIDESELTAQIRAMVKIKAASINNRNEKERLAMLVKQQTMELRYANKHALNLLEELKLENLEREKSEKELQESNDKYNELISRIPIGIYSLLIQTTGIISFEYVSDRFCEILGADKAAVFKDSNVIYDKLYPDDRTSFFENRNAAVNDSGIMNWEGRFMFGQDVRWIRIESSSLQLDSGDSLWNGAITDITERKKYENELLEKEVQYHNLANSGTALIWASGLDKLCFYFNDPWLNFTGRTLEQEYGKGWTEGVHPDDFDHYLNTYVTSFDKREAFEMEYRMKRADGEYRWILDLGIPNYNSFGIFVGYIGHCFDITERKVLENVGKFLITCGIPGSGEDFFESLAKYLSQSLEMEYVCIDTLDGDGLTAHTLAIYNYGKFEINVSYTLKETPCGDVVGKTICCFPQNVCNLFPNDKALQELNAESYVGTTLWSFDGKPIGLIAIIGSKPLKNTNLAENILRLVSVRASGELERKKAELQNKKLSIAIEQSPTSIEITDTDGKIEYVNKKFVELTGYSYEEVIGKNPRILSSGKTNPLVFVDLWKTITTGLTWSGELINKRKDGTEFIEFAIIAPITDDNGLITNYVAIKEDITASKIANEELRLGVVKLHKSEMALHALEKEKEVNDLKARFVSTASHEFRNPLAVITLTNESLINYWERLDRDQIITKLDRIRSQVTHLSSIVNDVLQVSKIQEGKQVLRKKEVDLVLLCKDVISDFDETKSNHDIEFECNTSSVLIEIDLRLIGQVLNNLISNALKYSTDANPIFVRIESTDHEVIVKVQDSGIGIPLVDQKHLFEPFFRANNCTMIPGNGLGLNIAREIIRQHGGEITFVSKENKGTTFEFNLPIK